MKHLFAAICLAVLLAFLSVISYADETAKNSSHINELKAQAEQGNAEAQVSLGNAYENGVGVKKDPKEAAKWWRMVGVTIRGYTQNNNKLVESLRAAAAQGNTDAQNSLGQLYFRGDGVPQDFVEAVKWYRKAAEQGNAAAQANLGDSYYWGYGSTQNYDEAVKWWVKAAEQGYEGSNLSHPVCRIFGQYFVRILGSKTELGADSIEIFKSKQASLKPACLINNDTLPIWSNQGEAGIFFMSIYRHYLVLDNGTGPIRDLMVIDLDKNTKVGEALGENEAFNSEKGILSFDANIGDVSDNNSGDLPCLKNVPAVWQSIQKKYAPIFDKAEMPDCREDCQEEGMGTGFNAGVEFDLNTLKKHYTGKVYCAARE